MLADREISFTYDDGFIDSGSPGLSLMTDPQLWGRETITYPISESIPLHPRLTSLVPGSNPRNLQRKHYLNLLRKQIGREPSPGIETEWRLLMMGGHGGIGHVDLFENDLVAQQWYQRNNASALSVAAKQSSIWKMLKRVVLDEPLDFDPNEVDMALGPTPSVGGMISKMLVGIDLDRLDSTNELVLTPPDAPGAWNTVLKIEAPEYAGLMDLEALCLDLHTEAGFKDVPMHRRHDDEDLHFLAIERFDHVGGTPLPMESLFSVLASADHDIRSMRDIQLEDLPRMLDRVSTLIELDPDTPRELYRRIIIALLTGNGDLHLENLSLLGSVDGCALSPVYDPAPMRAWPRHNLRSAIPYDPADYASSSHFFIALGGMFEIPDWEVRKIITDTLDVTDSYVDRIAALVRLPENPKRGLIQIVEEERLGMERALQEGGALVP